MKNSALGKIIRVIIVMAILLIGSYQAQQLRLNQHDDSTAVLPAVSPSPAGEALTRLVIKGRSPKTGYTRTQFSDGWDPVNSCDVRNVILARDMTDVTFVTPSCKVASGTLQDSYTGKAILFVRGPSTSDDVQIDHVVALSDAWQKGAQQLNYPTRHALANDPLNLLAVDGTANQIKSDGDAATWLPSNKPFRCSYVARQIAVKTKYQLWVTRSEYDAIAKILQSCPTQTVPV